MKPPTTTSTAFQQTNETQRVTRQTMNRHNILAAQAFTMQNEYNLPAVRAVWTVIDSGRSEEENENRRKGR